VELAQVLNGGGRVTAAFASTPSPGRRTVSPGKGPWSPRKTRLDWAVVTPGGATGAFLSVERHVPDERACERIRIP
jgi:hypothetical protein